MPRKKVDERVRTLLVNGIKNNHRSLMVVVGDHGKDQVVNLHFMLSKLQVKQRPSVLWCYKKELGFSSYRKKRIRQIKKLVRRGLYDAERDDPFDMFISSTNIRWAFYKESDKVLGQTFGMCVLQDFEALTPNLLARTIETVEGGGLVVVLIKKLDSLKQLFSMVMDVHSRFRTASHQVVKPRFNERWLLSLSSCETCMVVDDELNILPISKHMRDIKLVENRTDDDDNTQCSPSIKQTRELAELKSSLSGSQPAGRLVELARTVDQGKAILAFLDVLVEKSLAYTVSLTAARGRGKSAALGIAIASAIAFGYSNIFVTSPSPENLKTVFEFVFKAFDALEYKEHVDYEIVQSTNPDFNKAIVRVSVFHQHRQTIQYIDPSDHAALAQAELVVIDEAAAIPLPLVRKLLGPYLVFLSSTINGYEGTGRSLSLKLLNQLRDNQAGGRSASEGDWRTNETMYRPKVRKDMEANAKLGDTSADSGGVVQDFVANGASRKLKEIELEVPIRYSTNDPVEAWLNRVLCLDATNLKHKLSRGTPHPNSTELYAVDRDVLFSHHAVSETLLQRIVSLFVTSHYKNSPDDLMLLSDAPAHRLFVLLGPQNEEDSAIPDILCAVQVCLEGGIAKDTIKEQLRVGNRAAGDLVPWTLAQQFQDDEFGKLNGARIVRIASNPGAMRMGYGKRAISLLKGFYEGEFVNAESLDSEDSFENMGNADIDPKKGLLNEKLKSRKNIPPMLVPISDIRPPRLHYLSVSYGLTSSLFNFWSYSGFRPVYLRQTPNGLTGEHTSICLRPLKTMDLEEGISEGWERGFCKDFARRLIMLLAGPFRHLPTTLGLELLTSAMTSSDQALLSQDEIDAGRGKISSEVSEGLSTEEFKFVFLPHDLKRLEAYAHNIVDYHMVTDLLPVISQLFVQNRLPDALSLSLLQRALLVGMGLQRKSIEDLAAEYHLPVSQLLALFNKAVRKLSITLQKIMEREASAAVDSQLNMKMAKDRQEMLKEGKLSLNGQNEQGNDDKSNTSTEGSRAGPKQPVNISQQYLEKFAVPGSDELWENATNGNGLANGAIVSIASDAKRDKSNAKRENQREKFGNRSRSKRHKR